MSLIRAVIGFMFFELLFWLRENSYSNVWIGAVIGASTVGLMIGNGLASPLRSRVREELMLTTAIIMIAVTGIGAAVFGGVGAAIVLAAVVNLASGIGRMAFDSIVQRDAPDANQGRAFAKFETRFQLSWVVAGVIPVLVTFPGRVAFLTVGLIGVLAVVLYVHASRAALARQVDRSDGEALSAGQLEAGEPQARRVDLGRGRQGVRAGEKHAEPRLADAIDDAADEDLAALHLIVRQAQAEQPFDEHVVGVVLDPSATDGLGDAQRVAADDPDGDRVDHVVDVADRPLRPRRRATVRARAARVTAPRRAAPRGRREPAAWPASGRRSSDSSDESFSATASGSGRNAPTCRRTSDAKSSRSDAIENSA